MQETMVAPRPFKALLHASAEAWRERKSGRVDACVSGHLWQSISRDAAVRLENAAGRMVEGADVEQCSACDCLRVDRRGSVALIYPSARDKAAIRGLLT
jgi:hypothetical protein